MYFILNITLLFLFLLLPSTIFSQSTAQLSRNRSVFSYFSGTSRTNHIIDTDHIPFGAKNRKQSFLLAQSASHSTATTHDPVVSHSESDTTMQHIPDSLSQDSVRREELKKEYLSRNRLFNDRYILFPQSADSLFNPYYRFAYQIYATDAMTLSDILQFHPGYITVPAVLSSNLSRTLFLGFTAAAVTILPDNSLLHYYAAPSVQLPNLYSASQIRFIQCKAPGVIIPHTHPSDLAQAETMILWENGVFKENRLNVRFARPLTKSLHIGIFSNYQHFDRVDFTHSRNDIDDTYLNIYKALGIDTSYLSLAGRNPLTDEHTVSINLTQSIGKDGDLRASYHYADLHNDFAVEVIDSLKPDSTYLGWEKRSHYRHFLNAQLFNIRINETFGVSSEGFFEQNINRFTPLTADIHEIYRRGKCMVFGGALQPYMRLFNDDTLSLHYGMYRYKTEQYNSSKNIAYHTDASLLYKRHFSLFSLKNAFHGKIGSSIISSEHERKPIFTGKAVVTSTYKAHQLHLYALQDIIAPVIPFDSTITVSPDIITSPYQSFGIEGTLRYKKAALYTGASFMTGIKEEDISETWQNSLPPYKNPGFVFFMAPMFGKWKGLSMYSQWLFSNTKPIVKNKSILSYHVHKEGRAYHLIFDLGYHYWSKRDSISFAGESHWHRQIHDVSFKTTLQIKSFRLFYKVDNLFNGNFSYIPGYHMPGLVFRWGFNWLIQG